jgi:hypothetical protein
MNIIKNFLNCLDKFTIHSTYKKKSLIIASLGIIANFFLAEKGNSKTYFPKKKKYPFETTKAFKKLIGAKNKKIGVWFKSDRNFIISCIENIKATRQISFYRQEPNINNNISCHDSLVLIEKLNEGEKLRNKISKFNLGELVFSGFNLVKIENFKIFSKLEIEGKPFHQNCLPSFATLSNFNPDMQFSMSLFFQTKDSKKILNFKQHIPLDHVRGSVFANFGSKSGSILSNNFIIMQKLNGFYSKKNLSQAFNKQIKNYSIKFRPLFPTSFNKKPETYTKPFLSRKFIIKKLLILKVFLRKCHSNKFENLRKFVVKKNETRNNSIYNEEFNVFRIHNFLYHSRRKNKFSPNVNRFKNLKKYAQKSRLINFKNRQKEKILRKCIFSQSKIKEIILIFTLFFEDYFKKKNTKLKPTKNFSPLDSLINFSKRYVNLHKMKKYKQCIRIPTLKSTQKIDIRLNRLNKEKIEITKLIGENIRSYKNFIFPRNKVESHSPLIAHSKNSKDKNENVGIKLIGMCFSIGMLLPKSNVESSKFFNLSSTLGNSGSQFHISNIFFLGKCFCKNLLLCTLFSTSSSKKGDPKATFNTAIYLKKKIGNQGDLYRAFNLLEKVKDYSTVRRKIARKSKSREKSDIFKRCFASFLKIREYKIMKNFVFSLFLQNMVFLPSRILEISESTPSTLNFQNLSSLKKSMQSIINLSELLLENGQDFLSIEKFRFFPDFIPSSHFHVIFSRISGIGFGDGPLFSKRTVNGKSGNLASILLKVLYSCGIFMKILNYWFIYFLSMKFINGGGFLMAIIKKIFKVFLFS